MNINQFLFTRTQPKKKLEVISHLTENELLSVNQETIKKIVKTVGNRCYKSRDKELYISSERRRGNSWNSVVESVELIRGKLHLNFYIQYENTDTNTYKKFEDFVKYGNFRGEIRRSDRYGNDRTYYFIYNPEDKAKVIRSILQEYVHRKYADKLKTTAA